MGIEADLHNRIREALLGCAPFESTAKLRALFVDARISAWRNMVSDEADTVGRVAVLIDRLHDEENEHGENALMLLLQVLADAAPAGTARRKKLAALADELARKRPGPVPIPPHRPLPIIWLLGGALLLMIGFLAREFLGTPIGSPTPLPTPQPTPTLGIGSTVISERDGMRLVYVPPGEFLMGSSEESTEADDDEKPQHNVYLDAFWIDRTEVTIGMYKQCVQERACQRPSPNPEDPHRLDSYYDNSEFAKYPVIYVSWYDAQAYCGWAGRRLPTEAEWEKAARGTLGERYPWGNEEVTAERANFCDWNCSFEHEDHKIDDGFVYTAPVGSYPEGASPYGALDMAGNVWEWVADFYVEEYYQSSPPNNPISNSTGTTTDASRVMRGGSWGNDARWMRTTHRGEYPPSDRFRNRGFRCALSLEEEE